MDAAALRAMQAPLKEKCRTDAAAALITLKAKGSIDSEKISCKDAPQDKIDQLLKLTERYCVVYQILAKPPVLTVTVSGTQA